MPAPDCRFPRFGGKRLRSPREVQVRVVGHEAQPVHILARRVYPYAQCLPVVLFDHAETFLVVRGRVGSRVDALQGNKNLQSRTGRRLKAHQRVWVSR